MSPARAAPARAPVRAVGLVLVALAICAGEAAAEPAVQPPPERDAAASHLAGLRTATLRFPPPGGLVASLGAEYLPVVDNDLAGVRGDLLRLPTLGLQLALGGRAMFQVTWPAYNRLAVHQQQEPPPLGRRLGAASTDWGDVTAGTHLRLWRARGARPGCGFRFAARLPTTNEELAIGDNATDVFASLLVEQGIVRRLRLHTELGVGILAERTRTFSQNDVLTYGALLEWRARPGLDLVGEAAGHASTRTGIPGTGSRGELRGGVELQRGAFHWTALAVHGLNGQRSRGLGVSLQASTAITVFRPGGGTP